MNARPIAILVLVGVAACGRSKTHDRVAPHASVVARASASASAPTTPPGDYERALTHGSRVRTYRLHVPTPDPVTAAHPWPLVLAFHGGGGNAEQLEKQTSLRKKADDAGFVLVEPNGTGVLPNVFTWNAGNCCAYAAKNAVDDVGFVRAVLDAVAKELRIDPARIYATGFSNGAMMTHRLACELSDRIAAIAPVSGGIGDVDGTTKTPTFACTPARRVPVLAIHGLKDEAYPFGGGTQTCSKVEPVVFRAVAETDLAWAARNGCAPTSRISTVHGQTTCRTHDGCAAEVTLCTLANGKHDWPGGVASGGPCSGPTDRDYVANDWIWEFFEAHPMRDGLK